MYKVRNFKETLGFCTEHKVDIHKALIANEVDYFFAEDGAGEGGAERGDFEQLCSLAEEAYYKVDNDTSLSAVVDSLRRLIDSGKDINTISRHDIIQNL